MSARLIKKRDFGHATLAVTTEVFAETALSQRPANGILKLLEGNAGANSTETTIIQQARVKATEIEDEARQNAAVLLQAEVDREISQTIDPWRAELSSTLNELNSLRVSITAQVEREVARLAIEIAKKVVHREVTIDNEIVMTLARLGLSRMHNRVAAKVHLHPDDFAYVDSNRRMLDTMHTLELVEDSTVGRGGCLVQTEMGDVDVRIDRQFAEIERAFLNT